MWKHFSQLPVKCKTKPGLNFIILGENQPAVPRPKKFFKSRSENVDSENAGIQATVTSAKILEPAATMPVEKRPAKKFFLQGRNSSTDDPPAKAPPPEIPPPRPQRAARRSPVHRTPLERSPVDWSPVRPPLGKWNNLKMNNE